MFETYQRAVANGSKALGFEPVPTPLNSADREQLATWANLRGVKRDDPMVLGNALRDFFREKMSK
jgi:hypothetical protein